MPSKAAKHKVMLELWTSGKVFLVLTDVCYNYIPLGCNGLFHPASHLQILYMLRIKLYLT